MTIFASNTDNINTPTELELGKGFAGCDGDGMKMTSANINGVINKVTQQAKDCCNANSAAISDAIDLINTNTENIATNTNDIAANKGAISKNTAAIAKNVTAIAANKKSTTTNGNSINDLQSEVDSLKAALEKLQNPELYKVGDIYTTTSNFTTGAQVAKSMGYGTWERYAEGKTLVGISTKAADPEWTKTLKSSFGAYEHKLTVAEMPIHTHDLDFVVGNISGNARPATQSTSSNPSNLDATSTGGDKPHNNVQPSIVVAYWLRTA